jgi:RHS repeat-associated protein
VDISTKEDTGWAPKLILDVGPDLCPSSSAKVAPGQCGCDVPDVDTDLDGTADCAEPSLVPSADSGLAQAIPYANDGTGPWLGVATTRSSTGLERSLIRFDQTEIDAVVAGNIMDEAILELTVAVSPDGWAGGPIDLLAMNRTWVEGVGWDPGPGSTWDCASDPDTTAFNFWSSDCSSANRWNMETNPRPYNTVPTATVPLFDSDTLVRFDVTADVQKFLTGTPNHGWILIPRESALNPGWVYLGARESETPPRLRLKFAPPGSSDGWSGPGVFNGVVAERGNSCSPTPSCGQTDTLAEINACFTPLEEKRLRSGWDFRTSDSNSCQSGFGFDPPWTGCGQNFAVRYRADMRLPSTGKHCFSVAGSTANQCGSLFVYGANVAISTGTTQCFDFAAGIYPIEWFYQTTNTTLNELHIRYCFGGGASCAPTSPIPASSLRTPADSDGWRCSENAPCSELCPCTPGGACTSDLECGQDLICTADPAARFDKPAGTKVCWDPECNDLGSPLFECGSPSSRCGRCPSCTPQCTGKDCGYDGCFGSCGPDCSVNESGCASNADCSGGLECAMAANGPNVCLPDYCDNAGLNPCSKRENAGMLTECGRCATCTPDCGGRECGPAPNGCGQCGNSSLGPAEYCSGDGTIREQVTSAAIPSIPSTGLAQGATTPGAIEGRFLVSDSGQATYTLPLRVPPGRNGVEPQLTLTYSSGGGNSYLGVGWGINGFSTISRCPRTIAQDGAAGGVLYRPEDRFCLDGQRLVAATANGPYGGGNRAEYRTEIETFSRITSVEGSVPEEPGSFRAELRDGRIMTFAQKVGGNTPLTAEGIRSPDFNPEQNPNDLKTHTWLLTQVEDRFGNSMRIEYEAPPSNLNGATMGENAGRYFNVAPDPGIQYIVGGSAREYYPVRITYTDHAASQADRSVEFHYRARRDPLAGYQYGVRFERTQLLDRVTAQAHGKVAFQYEFFYYEREAFPDPDQIHLPSALSAVRECARASIDSPSNDLTCKPETTFEYDPVVLGFEASPGAPTIVAPSDADADFVGRPLNGQDDVLYGVCSATTGRPCDRLSWILILNGQATQIPQSDRLLTQSGNQITPAATFVVDYDLDGRDDVLEIDVAHRRGNGRVIRKWSYRDDQLTVENVAAPIGTEPIEGGNIYLLDANGDKAVDMLICTPEYGRYDFRQGRPHIERNGWQLRLHDTINGFGADTTITSDGPPCDPGNAIDLNGDGPEELLLNTTPLREPPQFAAPSVRVRNAASQALWPMSARTTDTAIPPTRKNALRLLIDANGDGLSDVTEISDDLRAIIWLNTGSGFVSTVESSIGLAPTVANPYGGADFLRQLRRFGTTFDENSDGRTDLLVKANDATWVVLRSQERFFTTRPLTNVPGPTGGGRPFIYDADHDGLRDIVVPGNTTRFLRSGPPTTRLTAINDGLGARTVIRYAELSQDADDIAAAPPGPVYTHSTTGCGYPIHCRYPNGGVVREHLVWDQLTDDVTPGPVRRFQYAYTGAARDLHGLGSLGFESRVIVDGARNAIAAENAGYQVTSLIYRNKARIVEGPGQGRYPFVGMIETQADVTRTKLGRDRNASSRRTLAVSFPSPNSIFPHVSADTQRVSEGPPGSAGNVLKRVIYDWTYDDFGNVTHFGSQWADAFDQKPVDRTDADTIYAMDAEHLQRWLISLPQRQTLSATSAAGSLVRTQQIVYAEDAGGSGLFPYTGMPEQLITEPDRPTQRMVTRFGYNAVGNVERYTETGATIDGALSRTTTIQYDNEVQLFPVLVTDNNGHTMDIRYDPVLVMPVSTREIGRPNNFVFRHAIPDGFGQLRRSVEPDGATTSIEYLAESTGGLSVRTTRSGTPSERVFYDVLGRPARREYDGFDRTLVEDTLYNAMGTVRAVSRPRATGTAAEYAQTTYDALGRPLVTTLPNGNQIIQCHLDNVSCTRNPRGFTGCEVFNEHQQLVYNVLPRDNDPRACESIAVDVARDYPAEGTPLGSTVYQATRYRYDAMGGLLSTADAAGNTTTLQRDDYGRVRLRQDPDAGGWTYTYNAFGQTERIIDPDAREAVFRYDSLGRLVSRTDLAAAGSPQEVTRWTWDIQGTAGFYGQLLSSAAPSGVTTTLTTDNFGRLITAQRSIPGAGGSQVLRRNHEYDSDGRLSMLRFDSVNGTQPMRIRHGYNARGYLSRLSRPSPTNLANPSADTNFWTPLATDVNGQLTSERFGNNVLTASTYEPATGYLDTVRTTFNTTELLRWNHDYDSNGNLRIRQNLLSGAQASTTYVYDRLDRVLSATTRATASPQTVQYAEAYTYDATGNVLTKNISGSTAGTAALSWTYNYNPPANRPHAVKSISSGSASQQFQYNASGEMTSRSAGLQGSLAISYNRFHMPSRVGTSATSTDGMTFTYDAEATRVRKLRGTAEVFYLDDYYSRSRATSTGAFTERVVIHAGDRAVAELVRASGGTETISFVHTDQLGSVEMISNQAGQASERRTYEAYGRRRATNGSSTFGTRGDFTGHELDTEFGLINMKARLYDPRIGRFLTPDPVTGRPWSTQGLNPYTYVEGNPANLVDPTGLQADGDDAGSGFRISIGNDFCIIFCVSDIFSGRTFTSAYWDKVGSQLESVDRWLEKADRWGDRQLGLNQPPDPPVHGVADTFNARGETGSSLEAGSSDSFATKIQRATGAYDQFAGRMNRALEHLQNAGRLSNVVGAPVWDPLSFRLPTSKDAAISVAAAIVLRGMSGAPRSISIAPRGSTSLAPRGGERSCC